MERLKIFREFLYGLTASLKIMHTAEELRSALYDNITGTSEIRSYTGVIEKYFDDKGFGFIQAENGKSFFFHFKNCKTKGKIQPGVPVKFSLQPGKKGLEAKEIEIMT